MKARRSLGGLVLATSLLWGASVAAQGDATAARELFARTLEALPRIPFVARLRLTTDLGETRELELRHKVVGGARASYLEVVAPTNIAGIRFLFLEYPDRPAEQYMKVTGARSSVRIASHVRRRPFLGSTFYVADMVEPRLDEFDYRFVEGEEKLLGRDCVLVEALPKDGHDALYGKIVFAIAPEERLVLRRNFFDKSGEPLKVWTVEKLEKIDGIWTPLEQRMRNVQEKTESTLVVESVRYNVEIDDTVFTPQYLLR
ncbi:MAG: hypothetical protein KatS3mg076_2340 [Candidatus Binatia bacterium]|nr:MAG: hypothetical protein KatS3mg076_2340 [Candidatus Binatia bacterium]